MPVYDYECSRCGSFAMRRPMAEFRLPATCPRCGEAAPRLVGAPLLNLMAPNLRIAEARNEKSAHQPDVVQTVRGHGHGGHGHPHHDPAVHKKGHKHHRHGPARPWMVGH